jgi:hypothetical protein
MRRDSPSLQDSHRLVQCGSLRTANIHSNASGSGERTLLAIRFFLSFVSLLVTFNHAIDGVIQNNPKARANPKALAQLDGYNRPLVSSRPGNLERFGMESFAKLEALQEIIAEMSDFAGNSLESR